MLFASRFYVLLERCSSLTYDVAPWNFAIQCLHFLAGQLFSVWLVALVAEHSHPDVWDRCTACFALCATTQGPYGDFGPKGLRTCCPWMKNVHSETWHTDTNIISDTLSFVQDTREAPYHCFYANYLASLGMSWFCNIAGYDVAGSNIPIFEIETHHLQLLTSSCFLLISLVLLVNPPCLN